MSFIIAHFTTGTSTELMSGVESREWVHHNSTNATNQQTPMMIKQSMIAKNMKKSHKKA